MKHIMEFDSGVKLDANKERIIVISSDGKKFEFDKNGAFIEPNREIIQKPSLVASTAKSRTWDVFDYIKQGHYVDYTPDIAEFVFDGKDTGTDYVHRIETEKNTIWRVFYVDKTNDRIVITTQDCVNNVMLLGKKGYDRGPEVLHIICGECYSNRRLGIKASSMVLDDVNKACEYKVKAKDDSYYYYNPTKVNTIVAEILGDYEGWLASPYVSLYYPQGGAPRDFCLYYAFGRRVAVKVLYYHDDEVACCTYGARPIVSLCSGLFADVAEKNGIGTSKEKAWKLISD